MKKYIELVQGEHGHTAVYLSDDDGGTRIAGSKPWGGGRTLARVRVDENDLREMISAARQALEATDEKD